MRSIPQVLLWETVSQGRWSLPGLFLLGNGLPLLVYGFLLGMGVNTADPAFVVLQFSFLPLIVLQFAMGIAIAQGPMSRLYALPISSHAIVAWHTLTGAAIVASETGAAALLYNSLFDADWPFVGPMLFAAVAYSALQLLQFIPTQPSLSGMCIAGTPLFALLLWLSSRYGSWLSAPTHYWREVSFFDGLILALSAVACFAMNIKGVRYARSGEPWPRLGVSQRLIDRWESLTLGPTRKSNFRSAAAAQLWYEFRLKAWGLPFLSALMMLIALLYIAYAVVIAPYKLLGAFEFVLALGFFQSAFALVLGAVFAIENNANPGEKRDKGLGDVSDTIRFESMGGFLAVRPIEDNMFSKVILTAVAMSIAIAYAFWLAALLVVLVSMWSTNQMPASSTTAKFGAWIVPLNLLGPWICMANTASIAFLAHRAVKFILAALGFAIGYFVLATSFQLRPEVVQQMHFVCISILSMMTIVLTIWVFERYHRARYSKLRTEILSATFATGILIMAFLLRPIDPPVVAYPLALAIAALSVLPFAAMPLAISASRHR